MNRLLDKFFRTRFGNFLMFCLVNIMTLAIALTPFWFYLLMRYLIGAEGALENILLFAIIFYCCFGIQAFLLIMWLILFFFLLGEFFDRQDYRVK